ncbi:MAG TPA: maleylpyruvate isomerase family mycothiol-dependent enzyme [Acidimicrobiales bacterium]|nr:maleylpyruvate isomerase family mycothiol-dependent enzyme [Acidimicrobiales bacterium]
MTSNDDQLDRVIEALAASGQQLADLVDPLTPEQLRQSAYPSEWTIADVLSHLGSGGVMTRRRLDGEEFEMQPIWDEWNAKSPHQQAADGLEADRAFLDRLGTLTPEDRARRFQLGPMDLDLASALRLRLSEHVQHTWDVAVTLDPTASIDPGAAELLIDSLGMMAGFAGRPTGVERTISVGTSAPTRRFELALRPDGVSLSPSDAAGTPDLELPAEALIRLVGGRLDPDHTPAVSDPDSNLVELRRAFPGY